jgi:dihydroorotase
MLFGLVREGEISPELLISKLTLEPARIIGDRFGKLGTLTEGSSADVTLIDPEREWTVDVKSFASKGKNSPLNGVNLKGKVVATFYQGKMVYRD